MKSIKNIIPYIFSICLIYFLFVFSFYIILYFDDNFLLNLFDKFNVYNNLPFQISIVDAKKISTELMQYLIGKRPFLETTININGEIKELYSITAKIHMSDVRNIFVSNLKCSYISLALSIICLVYCIKLNIHINKLFKAYKNILIFLFVIVFIILIYGYIDFDSFFMMFHKVLFTNEYYLFNPNIDYIILMLPQELFQFVGFITISLFIFLNIIMLFILNFLRRIQPRP